MSNEAKLKEAELDLKISEKLFLSPYLALAGYMMKLENLQFLAIVFLSLGMFCIAIKFKLDALKIYDEIYYKEDITKQRDCELSPIHP